MPNTLEHEDLEGEIQDREPEDFGHCLPRGARRGVALDQIAGEGAVEQAAQNEPPAAGEPQGNGQQGSKEDGQQQTEPRTETRPTGPDQEDPRTHRQPVDHAEGQAEIPGPAPLEPEVAACSEADERPGHQSGFGTVRGIAILALRDLLGETFGRLLLHQEGSHVFFGEQPPSLGFVQQMGFELTQHQSPPPGREALESPLDFGEVGGEEGVHALGPTKASTMATKRFHSLFLASRKAFPAGCRA